MPDVWIPEDYTDARIDGVPFFTTSDSAAFGRRQAIYEIPGAAAPQFEDLGSAGFADDLPMLVVGDDYAAQRNALIMVFQSPGPHVLEHPQYGALDVIIEGPVQVLHDDSQGRRVDFQVRVREVGGEDFIPFEDTASSVALAATRLSDAMITSPPTAPSSSFDFLARLQDIADDMNRLENRIASQLSRFDRVSNAIDDFTDGLIGVAATPDRLMAKLAAVSGNVLRLVNTIVDLVDPTSRLLDNTSRTQVLVGGVGESFDAGRDDGSEPPPASTTEELRQANRRALNVSANLLRISESSRQMAELEIPSSSQALQAQTSLVDALDRQVEQPVNLPPDVEDAAYTLRAAVTRHLTRVANDLQGTTVYTPPDCAPAFLVAHKLFGRADATEVLVLQNELDQPNFLTPGDPLEVAPDG